MKIEKALRQGSSLIAPRWATGTVAVFLLVTCLPTTAALAQVFDLGPSDPVLFDHVITLPGDPLPSQGAGGVSGETTQLNVTAGGNVGINFGAMAGSELNISGGSVGSLFAGSLVANFDAESGSEVNISGGTVGTNFSVAAESVVNLSGGSLGGNLTILDGGVMNISGGSLGRPAAAATTQLVANLTAETGSEVNISGGTFGTNLSFNEGSVANISGGAFVDLSLRGTGEVNIRGGEFKFNGIDLNGQIPGSEFGTLSGIFEDGSAFISRGSILGVLTLTEVENLPAADLSPIVLSEPLSGPSGLRPGQTLTLRTGGDLGFGFKALDATLSIEDGIVGDGLTVSNSNLSISGGTIGNRVDIVGNSHAQISGGTTTAVRAYDNSVVDFSDGVVGRLDATGDSVVNIDGGTFEHLFTSSEVNIRGGTIDVIQTPAGELNLFGTEFFLDGSPLDLPPGVTATILQRNVSLSCLLADGSAFDLDLSENITSDDWVFAGATVTVTLVSATEPILYGDVNTDGTVNFLDIAPFIAILTTGDFLDQADINQDGVVNFLDIGPFIAILSL